MFSNLEELDRKLLNDFQRDLPINSRPFGEIARKLEITEQEVLARLNALIKTGLIARVGATIRPNTAGASTLAAMAVPEDLIDEMAGIVGSLPGVNHSYLREHHWNLWFVVTAPDATALHDALETIRRLTRLTLLDLRLIRPFNIDLGFSLNRVERQGHQQVKVDTSVLRDDDRPLLDFLSLGLPLVSQPFAAIGLSLGRSEDDIISRVSALSAAHILSRTGVIVRHRAIGWKANAMVVWKVPEDNMETAGKALSKHPGVTLCYQRNTVQGLWPFTLFSMIHARTRAEANEVLDAARLLPQLCGVDHEVLFSTRCFKQTGAMICPNSNRRLSHETYTSAREFA